MAYLATRTAPDGTVYEEEILTPEEEAALAAAGGIPAPGLGGVAPAAAPAAVPPPADTSMYAAPIEPQYQPGGAEYVPPYDPGAAYGAATGPSAYEYGVPPPPTDAYNATPSGTFPSTPVAAPDYNYAAAEPYGVSDRAIHAGGDSTTLRSQGAYGPAPLATFPTPPRRDYDWGAAEPSLADRTLLMRDTAPAVAPRGEHFNVIGQYTGPDVTLSRTRREDRAMAASAPPMPTANGYPIPDQLARGLMMDDESRRQAAEGVSLEAVLDPSTWIPEPQQQYLEDGTPVLGLGDAAFIPGPIAGFGARSGPRARSTVRQSPVRPTTPPAAGVGVEPSPAQRAVMTAWDEAAAMPKAPPSEPIPAPPGAGQARVSLAAQQALDEAAGRRALTEAQRNAARVLQERTAAQEAAAAAIRARAGRTTLGGTPPRANTTGTAQSGATVPSPGLGAANLPARRLSAKQLAAIAGLGGVGSAVVATNLSPPGETPAVIPDPGTANLPLQPGAYAPSTNPQTPADWQGATTRSLELMKDYSPEDWYAKTRRAPLLDATGTPRKAIAAHGADDAARGPLYVGLIRGGAIVPVGSDVSDEEFFRMLASADEAPPGWPPGSEASPIPDPAAAAAVTPAATTSVPPPVESLVWTGDTPSGASSGNGRSGGAGGWIDYGDSSGSSGRRSSSWDDFDRGFDGGQDFTWQDFLQQAGGNRRKAAFMARAANRRRRRQRGGQSMESDGGFWTNFPWDRPPTPIRSDILASLNEAFSQAFPNRRQ